MPMHVASSWEGETSSLALGHHTTLIGIAITMGARSYGAHSHYSHPSSHAVGLQPLRLTLYMHAHACGLIMGGRDL